ncbi:MAG: hypothetical protein Q8Q08_00360 [Candidatus Omnitrophota bacterium]|nr:hypothetical protein [Candidatus Omnitrophota bacterium]MDZ4241954.1 hypothetical protein [Candidatus Omnitrophota bacterium]
MRKAYRRGQTFIEYTLLLGVLVSILVAMTPLVRRGVQGMVKIVVDQVGTQKDAEQVGGTSGYLINTTMETDSYRETLKTEYLGDTGYWTTSDWTATNSEVHLNLGFTEKRGN